MTTQDQLVQQLCVLWTDVLGTLASPTDNFFELGGYSLLLIDLVARASNSGLEVAPEQVLEYPTPVALATALRAGSVD